MAVVLSACIYAWCDLRLLCLSLLQTCAWESEEDRENDLIYDIRDDAESEHSVARW